MGRLSSGLGVATDVLNNLNRLFEYSFSNQFPTTSNEPLRYNAATNQHVLFKIPLSNVVEHETRKGTGQLQYWHWIV